MAAKWKERMAPDDPDRKNRYPETRKSMDPLAEYPATAKVCARCKVLKPLAAFGARITKRWTAERFIKSYCAPCMAIVSREWLDANRVRRIAKINEWKARNPKKVAAMARTRNLLQQYGLTPEMYEVLLLEQGGVCAICQTTKPGGQGNRYHVDHDAVTGKVRGLLCTRCNMGLGLFRHTQRILQRATRYLKAPPASMRLAPAPDVGPARAQIDFLNELEQR